MNIVQLHERVRFWTDTVASPRFDFYDIDNALNPIIDQYVEEIYSGDNPREDSFQKTQRVRDKLGPLVRKAERDSGTGLFISLEDINYRYLVSLKVTFGTEEYRCDPLSYDLINTIGDNPYRRPRSTPNKKAYYIEEDGLIRIIPPMGFNNIAGCEMYFLVNPATVSYGIEVSSEGAILENGFEHIATVTPTTYHKSSVDYDLVIGDQYTPDQSGVTLRAGAMVRQHVNCDLRGSTHEEIAIRTAAALLGRPVDVLRNKT